MQKRPRITNAAPFKVMPPPGIKPYNIVEKDDNTAEILMYGEVVESQPVDFWTGEPEQGMFIVLEDFLKDLGTLQIKDAVTVRINSIGGEVEAGVAIYNRLKEMNNVTTIVDGLAASAASLILQAGSTRKIYNSSQVMAHSASVFVYGSYNSQELKGLQDMLAAANNQVIAIYQEKTGLSQEELKDMVEATTWMTGQEIIDNGFADEIITGKEATMCMSADRSFFLSNGIPMNRSILQMLPKNVQTFHEKKQPAKADAIENTDSKGGKIKMTLDELQKSDPDLVKQIQDSAKASVDVSGAEQTAVNAERKRIQDIESIEASIGDKELVKNAKYGENPMDAKDLAFAAMQKQASLGNNFLERNAADINASHVQDIGSDANNGEGKDQAQKDANDIAVAVNVAKLMRGGK